MKEEQRFVEPSPVNGDAVDIEYSFLRPKAFGPLVSGSPSLRH